MSHHTAGRHGGGPMRILVLALLFAAPLALGAVQEIVFVPLLVGCALAGSWAWWRARRHERHGHAQPEVPAGRVLLALHGLVLLQLVPLPPLLLRLLSPGSYAFYDKLLLTPPLSAWRPISVSPPDTLRGLAFLAGFSLLFLAVYRELASPPWRRRVLWTIVGAGLVITVEAFVQAASSDPLRIWGLWHPLWDWGVFGPYVNRNHFAGYLVMASAVALGLALEALSRLRGAWGRRRRGILALGDAEGNAALRTTVVVMVLVAGLVASASRGGISAFAAAALVMPFASRHKGRTAAAVLALASLGVAWSGLGRFLSAFGRGVRGSRVDLWLDTLKMFPRFPLLGDGLNAFSTAYPWYQTVGRTEWVGEAHNEYLQALLDTGLVGFVLFGLLLVTVFRRAFGLAAQGLLDLGILTALLGLAFHNLVDFNWQIPANAATWVALAALACREPEPAAASHEAEPGGPASKVLEAVAGRT